MHQADWIVIETTEGDFIPSQQHHKETVFTLSNGYLGTRGSFEEGYPGDRPATFINGVYDDVPVVFTELVNCPNWLSLVIVIEGERFRLDQGKILDYKRWLDLRRGILHRFVRWQSPSGNILDFRFERFASLADPHLLALRCQLTSVNYSGSIEVHTSLNGYADNQGYLHWDWVDELGWDRSICLQVRSRHSQIDLAMAAQLTIAGAGAECTLPVNLQGYPTLVSQFSISPKQTVTLEKLVTVFTSRDVSDPKQATIDKLTQLPAYADLLASHEVAWAEIWQTNDVVIEGDLSAQLAIRYNLFQLLSVAPHQDDRVSIPAKTLSGFAYRGHVFWDTEIFILPCLTYTQPDLARNLLTYRYHTLAGARRKARNTGYAGAMYAWESADTGNEVTPNWVPGPTGEELVRIWCGDIEQHISTDVAYAVWHYWQATQDHQWLCDYGAEMILDTAVFWGSRVEWNPEGDRYEIRNVIGPDEYHEQVDNNAFTNAMVRWHLSTALQVLKWLRQYDLNRAAELEQHLNLSADRLSHWETVIDKIWVLEHTNTGLIEQYEGFFGLEDIDLADYEPRIRSMQAILGIEGAKQRQVLKQPDVLMLLYLLRQEIFSQPLENSYSHEVLQTNWDYYVPRTDHTYGSSLGPAVHAILACHLDQPATAYEHFMRSALVDLADVRGNAHEGIHAASTGGSWQAVVFGFAGIQLTENGPLANPHLPAHWTRLKFNLVWQGKVFEFDLKAADRGQKAVEQRRETQLHPPSLIPLQGRRAEGGGRNLSPVPHPPSPIPHPLSPPPIAAIIFDLDGVLTDTSEFHYLGWKQLAEEEGIPFDRQANEALRGVSRRDSLLYLLQGRSVTEVQFQEMMDRKNGYYLDLIRTITPDHLLPGAADLLDELQAAGIRIAIGSASKNAQEVVQRLGIHNRVEAIADGYSVQNSKPAPDVFLHAAELLGIAPVECVVVEDAAAGIEAARRAGMRSIGLGAAERVGAADLVLPSLAGVHWHALEHLLSGAQPSAFASSDRGCGLLL